MLPLEYSKDPENAEGTCPGQGDDHWHDGVAESADTSDHDVHDTAEEICTADNRHSGEAVLDHLRIGRIDAE